MKKKIFLFLIFLYILSFSLAIDYTWLLPSGDVLVSGNYSSKSFIPGKNEVILKIKEEL